MRAGIVLLNLFALAWGVAACGALDLPGWAFALPAVLSLAVAWFCLARVRDAAEPPPAVARRIGRTVGVWSGVEAVLIAVAVFVLVRLGRPELIAPAVAIIVGLHFAALGRALPLPLYYFTAAGLVVVGAGALALPVRPTLVTAGIGAALVLYATSLALTMPALSRLSAAR
jgi:hypothetical protein